MKKITINQLEALGMFKKLHFKPGSPAGEITTFMLKQKYIPPDFFYEGLLNKLVTNKSVWLDVGCGKNLLPHDYELSKNLSNRAKLLVGIDPDLNINENVFVHKKKQICLEDFETSQKFNLITLRMVAEHVESPVKFVRKIARLTESSGLIVIYTVNKFGWIPFLTYITSFRIHLFFQKILWKVEGDKDTFPTYMRMNTKKCLNKVFIKNGFEPVFFSYLEEASIFYKLFKPLFWLEIKFQKLLTFTGIHIFKNNYLAVYKKLK